MEDKKTIQDIIDNQQDRVELVAHFGKSQLWKQFKKVKIDGDVVPFVTCNECRGIVKYTPSDGTGGLKRHAHRLVPTVNEGSTTQLKISAYATVSNANTAVFTKTKKVVTEAAVTMCAKDIRPFTTIEGVGFKELTQQFINIGASYGRIPAEKVLPCSQTVSNHVYEKYQEVKTEVTDELKQVTHVLFRTMRNFKCYQN